VNNLGTFGRWAFPELTEVCRIEADLAKKIEEEFERMVERFATGAAIT
jgi:type III restriction enzyme